MKSKVKGAIMGALAKKLLGKGKYNTNGYNNHDYSSGMYNGYNYRPGQYSNIRGRTCSNYLEYNGVVFGQFRCPIEGNHYDETECCGPMQEQYCCTPNQAMLENRGNNYNPDLYRRNSRSSGAGTIIFFLIFLLILIAVGLCMFNMYKKRIYEKVKEPQEEKNDVVA